MDAANVVERLLAFIETYEEWAVAIAALLVLGESIAFFSIAVPATALLLGVGALVGVGAIPFVDLMIACTLACLVGDAISFGAGRFLGPRIHAVWPFTRRPQLLAQGERVFAEAGAWSVLVGRFFGPLRAVVPLCAGAFGMKPLAFGAVSALSAPVFLLLLIGPSALAARGLSDETGGWLDLAPVALPLGLALAGGWVALRRFRAAHHVEDEARLDA